jgi:hypothetical protein
LGQHGDVDLARRRKSPAVEALQIGLVRFAHGAAEHEGAGRARVPEPELVGDLGAVEVSDDDRPV